MIECALENSFLLYILLNMKSKTLKLNKLNKKIKFSFISIFKILTSALPNNFS